MPTWYGEYGPCVQTAPTLGEQGEESSPSLIIKKGYCCSWATTCLMLRSPWIMKLWHWSCLFCTVTKIKPVKPKGSQPWIFAGRTDAEAEAPIFWPRDVKSPFIGKDPDAGKDWGWEKEGTIEDEIIGWHHWPNGRESEQALGDGEGQGSLVCCSPRGLKESDTTEWQNN